MRNGDANIFLNVDPYLNELVQSRLIPMFVEEIDCTELDKMPQVSNRMNVTICI